jgi:hypothetical protein
MFPFPRVISIPEDYRSVHLYPASDEFPLTNPLPEIFQQHAAWFEQGYDELTLTADESESGRYQASTIDALVEVAKDAVEQSPQAYAETLSAQNPELMDLVEGRTSPPGTGSPSACCCATRLPIPCTDCSPRTAAELVVPFPHHSCFLQQPPGSSPHAPDAAGLARPTAPFVHKYFAIGTASWGSPAD